LTVAMAKAAAAKGYDDEDDGSAMRRDREDEKTRRHDRGATPIRKDDEADDADEGR